MLEPGPGGALIREVVGQDSPYLPASIDLFRAIFPDETRYIPYVRACAQQVSLSHPATLDHVWLVEQDGQTVGIRVFSYVHTRNWGHGAYVGLLPAYQGQGLGAWLVRQTLAQLCADALRFHRPAPSGYVIEVEPPEGALDEADRQVRQRRLAFHRRCGGLVLDADYVEPPMIQGVDYVSASELDGAEPKAMKLVFIPLDPARTLTGADLVDFIEGLYVDVYRLDPASNLVCRALASIGK